MKLRNKKTGEIIDIYKGKITRHYNQGRKTIHFKCLEDLEEWEDYKEPKDYWWIDCIGDIYNDTDDGLDADKKCKQIGNYFETREEAKKAVEKLKAWKRLKDKGIRFNLDFNENVIKFTYRLGYDSIADCINEEHLIFEDMKLLFGGEE